MPYYNTRITNNSQKVSGSAFSGYQSIFISGTGVCLANPLPVDTNIDYHLSY